MLNQIHHQYKARTVMVSQREQPTTQKEVDAWWRETKELHPLPDNAQWMICNEDSEFFMWAVEEKQDE